MRAFLRRAGLVTCVLLCAALTWLWGRSTEALDCVFYSTFHYDDAATTEMTKLTGVFSKLGSLGIWHLRQRQPIPKGRARLPDGWTWSHGSASNDSWPTPNRFGFRLGEIDDVGVAGRPGLTFRAHGVMVPHWLLIALLTIPPTRMTLRLVRTTARARRGECLACGYDLRGGGDANYRCPECGVTRRIADA